MGGGGGFFVSHRELPWVCFVLWESCIREHVHVFLRSPAAFSVSGHIVFCVVGGNKEGGGYRHT